MLKNSAAEEELRKDEKPMPISPEDAIRLAKQVSDPAPISIRGAQLLEHVACSRKITSSSTTQRIKLLVAGVRAGQCGRLVGEGAGFV